MDMTLFVLGAVALFALVAGRAGAGRRGAELAHRPRFCRACMADHPPFANYCRHCGRQL